MCCPHAPPGESYAGIYVPMLALNVVKHNAAAEERRRGGGRDSGDRDSAPPALNLRGIIVGNGCLGSEVGACSTTAHGDWLKVKQVQQLLGCARSQPWMAPQFPSAPSSLPCCRCAAAWARLHI